MNKIFTNKFSAYQNTIGMLESNRDVYTGYPVAVSAVEEFRNIMEEIKVKGETAGFDNGDLTSRKDQIKHNLAEVISGMAAAVSMYAGVIADHELEAISTTTYSDIRRSRDFESLELARGFHSQVLKHREGLTDYMITDEDIDELASLIEAFDKIYVKREEVQSESVMDTQRLTLLFKKADSILREKIDMVVKKLRRVNPDFYNSYFQARMIVDL